MNVYIESLGCFKNKADTEKFVNKLIQHDIAIVRDPAASNIIIINTCGFIKPAVEESIERILELSKFKEKGAKLVAFGCMIERYKHEIKHLIPELDFTTGINSFEKLINYLLINKEKNLHNILSKKDAYIITNLPYYSYVKIADGCNNRCSYCMIPFIKGELKSVKLDNVKRSVKNLINMGVKEINIVAQDITKYGIDIYGEYKLCSLLDAILNIDGDFYIRLLYLNPDGIENNLLDLIKNSSKIIKYLDIPIQHASDKILKMMNRKIDSISLFKLFEKIRHNMPDLFLRTTAIVGFPSENNYDFNKLLEFINTFSPEWAGFFRYYPEEGTPSYNFKGRINKKIVDERLNILEIAQINNINQRFKKLIGTNIKVFIEKPLEKPVNNANYTYSGRSLLQAPEIDGKCYIKVDNNIAINNFGPYNALISDFKYPDIFVTLN
jgi:ribosomal protein S12 methylthiotransferase